MDLARHTGLARGGMYGARLDFLNRVLHRVSPQTAFENLYLTGATAGGPGLQGVVAAGTRLVETLLAAKRSRREDMDLDTEVLVLGAHSIIGRSR